jgi:formylglycine-generating enzyme required for sulfatase activity
MRKGYSLFSAVFANLTFLATDVLACSMCITALADYYLPPIILWVLIATTWFVLNGIVSSVTGISLKFYPKSMVLMTVIVILLFILAGAFLGLGVMLVLFVPAVAAFVQSFNPQLRVDFSGGTRAIYWIGVIHLVGVVCAAVLMVHTHLTRTPENFIVKWSGTSIALIKFKELQAQGPQALDALRYIKKNGGEMLAAKADESIKQIEDSENANRQIAPVADRSEKTEESIATVSTPAIDKLSWSEPSVTNSIGMTFVYIKPGTFMMGSPLVEPERGGDETQHQVALTKGFYMQTTEVTQGQWRVLMGNSPSYDSKCGDNCPVEQVSWDDVQEFIRRLNQKEGENRYRLPTEAEWEYACRAGTNTRFSFGDNESQLNNYAWYDVNCDERIHPVAKKQPNAWGLYDMHGNVGEWCQDWYGPYPRVGVTDPAGPLSGRGRIVRGGSYFLSPDECRSAVRSFFTPEDNTQYPTGFRLVMISSTDAVDRTKPAKLSSDRNEKDKDAVSQADEKIKTHEKKSPVEKVDVPAAPVLKPTVVKPSWLKNQVTNSIGMAFVYIKPGTFIMGAPAGRSEHGGHNFQHQVTLTKGFYMQTTEVTQGQWKAVMGYNPSVFENCGNGCPVEGVSLNDAQEFIKHLNLLEDDKNYRLPTEAEWEYACRAGTNTSYSFGDSESQLNNFTWCNENSGGQTHPVAKKQPNTWGLYDMHGNVWEWCQDWYGAYKAESAIDPVGPSSGVGRVNRGGSFRIYAKDCNVYYRGSLSQDFKSNDLGFRVARTR